MIQCKKCLAPIVFLKTKTGNSMPVNYLSLTADEKALHSSGLKNAGELVFSKHHISHFATCPDAESFRGKRK